MAAYRQLKDKIVKKKANIAVVGLGYVGLPIALEFAKAGFKVFGIENDNNRLNKLKKAESYITDLSHSSLKHVIGRGKFHVGKNGDFVKNADAIIVCVPTPLRKTKIPDISYIIKATRTIAKNLKSPTLIVLESTTYPGTTREVIQPILEKKGFREGKDFFLAFSPERIDPGNKKYKLTNVPKLVGGTDVKATGLAYQLYSKIIKKVIPVSNAETAEIVKLLENTFRIVNIALANEFAMVCDRFGIDVWEVIEAAKTKPFGFMPFYPGPGIGGHCIPADPVYLSWKAKKLGFKTKMIDLASKVNAFMPPYTTGRIKDILGGKIENSKILILGVTYKNDVKDLRESPALEIIESLRKNGAKVSYSDPYIPYLKINGINLKSIKLTKDFLKNQDLVVLITGHSKYEYAFIARYSKKVLDTRNAFAFHGVCTENIVTI